MEEKKMELTPRQKRALLLSKRGENNREISARLGWGQSSVHYAIVSGGKRLESAVKTIEWAGKNKVLSSGQVGRLKRVLRD